MTYKGDKPDAKQNQPVVMSTRYTEITEREMDNFLVEDKGFEVVDMEGVKEKVYRFVFTVNDVPVSIRVYSTIDERTGVSRGKGNDAIRVELYKHDPDLDEPVHVGHSKRVHRIQTWRKNLGKRLSNVTEMFGPACPSCGDMMVLRDSSNGKFWGCSNYHSDDCTGSRNYNS